MDVSILNLKAVMGSLNPAPKGQRIYNFFDGATAQLTLEQKIQLKENINKEFTNIIDFIETAILEENEG